MDAYLALVSLRVVREYADRPLPDDVVRSILEAGRATGSSRNTQPWVFHVVRSATARQALAETVYAPENLRACTLAIAISTHPRGLFDVGRCTQNLALAAWQAGVGSCPNGVRDPGAARLLLDLEAEAVIPTILSLGYPVRPQQPRADDVQGILQRIDRRPFDDVVRFIDCGSRPGVR